MSSAYDKLQNRLRFIKDSDLLQNTERLAREERELLTKVLHHLKEIDRRKLFSSLGFRSLFDFATKRLGYSEDQAYRRISAMRLLREMPELEEKINEGSLNLTHLGMAQNIFKQEKKMEREIPATLKMEILDKISSKPVREAESVLRKYSSNIDSLTPDRTRLVSEGRIELKFTASKELLGKIETLKGYLAHSDPNLSLGELFEKLCDVGLEQFAPSNKGLKVRKIQVSRSDPALPPAAPKKSCVIDQGDKIEISEAPPQRVTTRTKRMIFEKASNRCELCRSTYALEIDHIVPRALSGNNHPQNLRVLCRNCNQSEAWRKLRVNCERS